jgi:hypothetical protein
MSVMMVQSSQNAPMAMIEAGSMGAAAIIMSTMRFLASARPPRGGGSLTG